MVNLGILNDKFIKKLSYVLINESNNSNDFVKIFGEYNEVIKKDINLLKEFMVYENLTSVSGINENGLDYINTVLSGLDGLTLSELNESRRKLIKFESILKDITINNPLLESINFVVDNTLSNDSIKDTKKLWEAENFV